MLDANSLRQTLTRGGPLRFAVSTSDMTPHLNPQDIVSVRKTTFAAVKPGDIVLCKIDERIVLRKVVGKKSEHYGTPVVEVQTTEPSASPTRIPDVCVLGKVTAICRAGEKRLKGISFWDALMLRLGSILKRGLNE